VPLEAISELAQQYNLHTKKIIQQKQAFIDKAFSIFNTPDTKRKDSIASKKNK